MEHKSNNCIVCGIDLGNHAKKNMSIMCEKCKKDPEAQKNRPYTKDTAFLIRKYYKEYREKGVSHKKTIKKIAGILARSEENVLKAIEHCN